MTFPLTFPAMLGGDPLLDQCEAIWETTEALYRGEKRIRREEPLTRIWDSEWGLHFILGNEYKATFSFISNDTGPGQTEIPFDSAVAQWIHDHQGRIDRGEGRTVCITVDYCGARWSGFMDKYSIEMREDGDQVLVVDWLHDYEHLKWYSVWPNPLLPAAFQFPRAFVAAGPVTWLLRFGLFCQIFREHNPLITWPDDPMSPSEWFHDLDQSQWHTVVKPLSFLSAMQSGVVWGVLISRMGNWHDVAKPMLDDSELSVRCDRYLDGDELPWEGANIRHGALVIDIVDKSGVHVGTSSGGNLFTGIRRTYQEFTDDFIDSTDVLISDLEVPPDYYWAGSKFTRKELPYVVFQEGDSSPVQSSAWINSPAKGVQVLCGGHSMPGVNEAISASIQALGDILGSLAQIGSLGGAIDSLLKPLYEDVILAWWAVKSGERARNTGWSRLFEYFQSTGTSSQAYTLASLMVLRAGFWATKTTISWRIQVSDAAPFMVGDRNIGHFFLDDRVGLVVVGDDNIHMDRCRKLDLAWDPDNPPEWQISIGDDRILEDPAQRAWGKIEALIAGLRDLGVW